MSSMSTDWRATLREKGYRLTPQRELILSAVDTLGHATPDEVLAEVRKHSDAVNVSTVYRTLEVLEELGLIRHAHISDRAPTYHSVRATTSTSTWSAGNATRSSRLDLMCCNPCSTGSRPTTASPPTSAT